MLPSTMPRPSARASQANGQVRLRFEILFCHRRGWCATTKLVSLCEAQKRNDSSGCSFSGLGGGRCRKKPTIRMTRCSKNAPLCTSLPCRPCGTALVDITKKNACTSLQRELLIYMCSPVHEKHNGTAIHKQKKCANSGQRTAFPGPQCSPCSVGVIRNGRFVFIRVSLSLRPMDGSEVCDIFVPEGSHAG